MYMTPQDWAWLKKHGKRLRRGEWVCKRSHKNNVQPPMPIRFVTVTQWVPRSELGRSDKPGSRTKDQLLSVTRPQCSDCYNWIAIPARGSRVNAQKPFWLDIRPTGTSVPRRPKS